MLFKVLKKSLAGSRGLRSNVRYENMRNGDRYAIDEYIFNCDTSIIQASVTDGVSETSFGAGAAKEGILTCHHSFHGRMLRKYVEQEQIEYSVSMDMSFMESQLKESIMDANKSICERNRRNGENGATTISSIAITDRFMVAASVGDSPIYYYRQSDRSFRMINFLQTEADERFLVDEVELYSDEYYNRNHILTHVLGAESQLNPVYVSSYVFAPIEVGDMILLGTDGAFGRLRDEEVARIIEEYSIKNNKNVINNLFKAANSTDDQTAVLISVEGF